MYPSAIISVELQGVRWHADATRAIDLSIGLDFAGPQPNAFGAADATANALVAGDFVGDVRRGGSCNCVAHVFTPHCNGTHTECVGHLTAERIAVREIAIEPLLPATLLSVTPVTAAMSTDSVTAPSEPCDPVITARALEDAFRRCSNATGHALVVRTLPNPAAKRQQRYGTGKTPPYFTAAAMQWIVKQGVQHLIVDLPSLDRAQDAGKLTAHRIFWGLPVGSTRAADATRPQATVTELAFIDDSVADGTYLVNLQIAPFVADAAPSRPILFPLVNARTS